MRIRVKEEKLKVKDERIKVKDEHVVHPSGLPSGCEEEI